MQLYDVVEITETQSLKKANDLLAVGWKLVAVSTNHNAKGYPESSYVLGRSADMPKLPTRPALAELGEQLA